MTAVGDILDLVYGKALKAEDRSGGDVAVVGSGGIVGRHSTGLTDAPTIVVGRKGSIGSVTWIDGPAWPIDTSYFVKFKQHMDPRWTFWMLKSLRMETMNKSAAVPGLNRDDVYRLDVDVPVVAEQRRIAAILDHADALRAKRRQVFAHLDTLSQSIFHDMFGRVSAGATVEDISTKMRTGPFGSQLLHSEFVAAGVSVLGLDNVVTNEFRWADRRYITLEKYEQLKRYTVRPGDVLISIMGTTGRCVVVPDNIPTAINTKHICAITPDREQVDPVFLRAAFLGHPESRAHLQRQTKGSIMDGLNMGIIKTMPVPVPELNLQRRFARRIESVSSQRGVVTAALSADDELFASLQARAFRGEL